MYDEHETRSDPAHAEELTELAALDDALQPLSAPPVAPKGNGSQAGFQFPRRLWALMLICYGVFFAAIAMATGGSGLARFVIIISVLYTVIYFGVARIGARQAGKERSSPLDRGEGLSTCTGKMSAEAVYSQVLIVPVTIALFGIAIMIICQILL